MKKNIIMAALLAFQLVVVAAEADVVPSPKSKKERFVEYLKSIGGTGYEKIKDLGGKL